MKATIDYREDKATQLAAYLISRAGGKCNYTILQKMLFDCDHLMLLERGRPITYDKWASLNKGPVLSTTLNIIRGKRKGCGYWTGHILTVGKDVVLVADPGDGELSDVEIRIADRAFAEFGHLTLGQAIEKAHKIFKEWSNPGRSSTPITYPDILRANGRDDPAFLEEVNLHPHPLMRPHDDGAHQRMSGVSALRVGCDV